MEKKILYLSPTYGGRVHDKAMCTNDELTITQEVNLFIDLGFQGFASEKAKVIIPHKQKRNSELTQEQKQENQIIGKARVAIEHMIGGIKISRIVNDKYRGRMMHREDTVMLIACGLYNLKSSLRNAA